MRLTKKKLEEIILTVLGGDGLPLVKELYDRENVSEFELASKTKKDIKVIRKQLYVLYNNNLVAFTRKKDKEKGWYIYYWTLVPDNIRFMYFKKKKEQVAKLLEQLEREKKELFFVCSKNCVRLTFDQAMDFEFHCPECGELATQDNPEKMVKVMQQELQQLLRELKEDEQEKKRVAKHRSEKVPKPKAAKSKRGKSKIKIKAKKKKH